MKDTNLIRKISAFIHDHLLSNYFDEKWVEMATAALLLLAVLILLVTVHVVLNKVFGFLFSAFGKRMKSNFMKYLYAFRFHNRLITLLLLNAFSHLLPDILHAYKTMVAPATTAVGVCMVAVVIFLLIAVANAFVKLLQDREGFRNKPFENYLQIIKMILFFCGVFASYTIVTGKSIISFLAAMGAASAVLMLLFKDTILGFAGSMQLMTNDMLRKGDWISMPQYGADGTVEEMNLTTVKVRNFDNTITTVPTYSLVSSSFQNWRGMSESGTRRFLRTINVIVSDVKFLDDKDLEKYLPIGDLKVFIEEKQKIFNQRNADLPVDTRIALNGHYLTNLDLFIQYAQWYLQNHPRISARATLLVRPQTAGGNGIPVQIYAFTQTTVWAQYEAIVAEVMNHLFASVGYFDLRVFEAPAASDSLSIKLQEPAAMAGAQKA
ncbi:MAG: mechanosensitive ion channel family protein [Burkholderiaceae bacterium]|nr:mechanosensitive ion channel family protein [Burkholderiaceae bacterium]